jgi:poly-gamma-glutamate synthesis protein (capsule biosynthesis protein)
VAKTFRADAEVIFEFEVPSVINAGSVRREALTAMQSLFGDTVKDASTYAGGMFARITGSEDFGFVSEEVPSLMVGLVAGIPADGHRYPMHHPMATFDERVLWKGAAVYAHTAMAWLKMYYKPIDLPRNMDQMLEAASESMRTAVEKYTAEALAQGRWSEPEEYDMNPANMAFAAYWLHKIRKPIVKGMKGFGLEAYFEKFKQNQSTWMPEAFTVDKTYRISASGDLMFGKYVEDSNGVLYQAVESLIFDADCAYANLESTLSKEVPKALSVEKEGDTPTINLTAAQYEVLIQHSGKRYDVLQIANNHIFDCGLEGAEMTMAQLESDGIAYTGVYKSKESSEAIVCTQMADVKIGWISHTFNLNINPLSAEEAWRCDLTPFHIVKSPDTTRIQKQIAKAREIGCDLVILTLHWGLEHEFYPHPDQLKWAHEFAELGVDAIIGHHPHVCQPYECYTPMHDPEKRVPILYSLGNLTPVYGAPATVLSLIANLTVAKGSMNGTQKTLITGIEITPVAYVGMVLQNKNYAALVPLKTLSETAMSEEMAAYFDEITPYADLVLGKTWR